MERRWGGLVIVVIVLLAAAILPALGGRAVPGTAVAGPVPGPPHIGDCLPALPTTTGTDVTAGGAPIYPVLNTKPCSGQRFGQVVAVIAEGLLTRPVEVADDDGVISYDDANRHICASALAVYLAPGSVPAAWSPTVTFSTALGRPSDLQRGAGQQWVVCIGYAAGSNGAAVGYRGELRTSTTSDLRPAGVATAATCLSSTNFFLEHVVDCTRPHPVESVAMLLTHDPSITTAGLQERCRDLVGAYTGSADPTAGGQLLDTVLAVHRASDGTQAPGLVVGDETGFARCIVHPNGSRLLTATLLGLGNRPVPWSH